MPTTEYAIFLNGSYGVGKSSTLDHLGDLLFRTEQPFSLLDVDWFHRSWPVADFDLGNKIIEAENMAFAWRNYRRVGPRQLVVSGVISNEKIHDRYRDALGLEVRPVRLVASPETTERRLRGRYSASQDDALNWHLERHLELTRQLADADLDELVIDTDALPPHQVAERVLGHFGLLTAGWKNDGS